MATYTVWNSTASNTIQEALVREDVNDLISNLFPLDTPLQQALGKVAMTSTFKEFPIDGFNNIARTSAILLAASGAANVNPKAEANTISTGALQLPVRFKCIAENQTLYFAVSDTDRAVSAYGYNDRFTYEAYKTVKAVVNNFEHSFWWGVGGVSGDTGVGGGVGGVATSGTAVRYTQGLMPLILKSGLERQRVGNLTGACSDQASFLDGARNDFGTDFPSAGANGLGTPGGTWAFNANGTALDAAMFKDSIMRPWYTLMGQQGGAMGFASPRVKTLFNGFAQGLNGQINERTIEAAAKMLVDDISFYDTEYGIVSINMSRYLNLPGVSFTINLGSGSVTVPCDENIIFIKPDYYKIGVLRGVSMVQMGKTGDLEQGKVTGDMGMMCLNPQAGTGACNLIP